MRASRSQAIAAHIRTAQAAGKPAVLHRVQPTPHRVADDVAAPLAVAERDAVVER